MNVLNEDCLRHIFSYLEAKELNICSKVCRSWETLSVAYFELAVELHHSLTGYNIQEFETLSREEARDIFKYIAPRIKTLQCYLKSGTINIIRFGQKYYRLKDKNLQFNTIVKIIGNQLINSEKLIIRNNDEYGFSMEFFMSKTGALSFEISGDGYCSQNILMNCKHLIPNKLHELRIYTQRSECVGIVHQALCKQNTLEKFHMSSYAFSDRIMKNLLRNSKTLKKLCLKFPYLCKFIPYFNTLHRLSEFINLKKLNITGSLPLTEEIFSNISRYCTKLVKMNFAHCNLSTRSFQYISSLPKLQHFQIENLVNPLELKPEQEMPHLINLIIIETSITKINYKGLCENLDKMPNLLKLSLLTCNFNDRSIPAIYLLTIINKIIERGLNVVVNVSTLRNHFSEYENIQVAQLLIAANNNTINNPQKLFKLEIDDYYAVNCIAVFIRNKDTLPRAQNMHIVFYNSLLRQSFPILMWSR